MFSKEFESNDKSLRYYYYCCIGKTIPNRARFNREMMIVVFKVAEQIHRERGEKIKTFNHYYFPGCS